MNQYQISLNEHVVSSHVSIPHPVHSHALKYMLGRSTRRKVTGMFLMPIFMSHITIK